MTAYVSSVDAEAFEAFPLPEDDVLEGRPDSRVHWLRREEGGERTLLTGLFRVEPSTFRYAFEADEVVHVLEGRASVQVEGGETVELAPGVIASFRAGDRAVWRVAEPLKEVFVLAG